MHKFYKADWLLAFSIACFSIFVGLVVGIAASFLVLSIGALVGAIIESIY